MAPGSVSSVTSSSSTVTAGSSASSESEKPGEYGAVGLSRHGVVVGRRKPSMLHMVLEALQAGEQRRGTSVVAIKLYILHKYPTVDVSRFKYMLKQALDTGLRRGLLTRPANSKAKGATGSFKLIPKHKRKSQPRKALPLTAARRAQGKGPANQSEGEKATEKWGEAGKIPPRPGATREKAPKRGSEAVDVGAKPDKATRAPSSTNGLSSKIRVKGTGRRQGGCLNAVAGGPGIQVPSSPWGGIEVRNGAAPTKQKIAARAPTGTVALGTGEKPKSKAAAPSQGGPKVQSTQAARKRESTKESSFKGSSSKVSSKKAEARS
uniref:Histone H1.8 n=1 Tax=Castor canadensis TaxID=51338 RepID=A0A8C0W368_CASCN